MAPTLAERNKQLALKAFDTLFNRHDYEAAATMWSEGYIQHRAPVCGNPEARDLSLRLGHRNLPR